MEQARFVTLFSSSKGNAAYIKYGRDEILIDCGVSARMLERALKLLGTSLASITALFITHEHGDHIRGLETICARTGFPVYAPEKSCAYLEPSTAGSRLRPMKPLHPAELADLVVCPVKTPHDSLDSCGFRINAGGEKLGYFTDIGCLTESVLRGVSGCRRVVFESNHDIGMLKNGSYPPFLKKRILGDRGHLSNDLCARLLPHLVAHGTESISLAHLSEQNNRPLLALSAAEASLSAAGITAFGADGTPVALALGREETGSGEAKVRLQVSPVCGIAEL